MEKDTFKTLATQFVMAPLFAVADRPQGSGTTPDDVMHVPCVFKGKTVVSFKY